MKLEDLDQQQRDVVDTVISTDNRVLVLGGAGTGKTTTSLWTARTYLETSSGIPQPRVLFLTFSRAAVSQIVSRSPGVLAGSNSRIEILTFHGLCHWLLRAFGRYAGYGVVPISVQSDARTKLLGHDTSRLRYDDLIPGATSILKRSERLRNVISSRWGLVICDEAQDTSTGQWELIQLIGSRKLVLLGDFNQMIYSSLVPGVSPAQFERVRAWVDREVELLPRSHRDPSGVIPSVAEAVRVRDFEHEAVVEAIRTERLYIHFGVADDDYQDILVSEINKSRRLGLRDVGVFAHSNVSVSEVAELLNSAGIDHALIGIPEAHSEALGSMAVQCAYAVGLLGDDDIRECLALFLTASVRGRDAPPMALALIRAGALPSQVDRAIGELESALTGATYGTMGDLGQIAMESWAGLGLAAGYRAWQRAAQHFTRLLTSLRDEQVSEDAVHRLQAIVDRSQTEALMDLDYSERSRIKLMTYHQTKSREADTAIHVYRRQDFFGREGEPFEEASRLLNVAITRARKRLVLLLPHDPHPLVEPFNALRRVQESVLPSIEAEFEVATAELGQRESLQ